MNKKRKSLRLHWLKAREESRAVPGGSQAGNPLVHAGIKNQAAQDKEESIQDGIAAKTGVLE